MDFKFRIIASLAIPIPPGVHWRLYDILVYRNVVLIILFLLLYQSKRLRFCGQIKNSNEYTVFYIR